MNTGTNSYAEIIFRGSKGYFGARNNLDMMIVEHPKFNCLELIVYKSSISVEAPRMYFSKSMISALINKESFQSHVEEKKEKFIREKKVVDTDVLTKMVWNLLVSRCVLDHIEQDTDVPDSVCRFYVFPPFEGKSPVCLKSESMHAFVITELELSTP